MIKLLFFLLIFCGNLVQKESVKMVQLSYQTRGTQKTLRINADSIVVTINTKTQFYKTSAQQWHKIKTEIEKLNMNSISGLKRPSTKSYSDAAMAANLKVFTSKKEYESSQFDHHNPNAGLMKLINCMKETLKGTNSEAEF